MKTEEVIDALKAMQKSFENLNYRVKCDLVFSMRTMISSLEEGINDVNNERGWSMVKLPINELSYGVERLKIVEQQCLMIQSILNIVQMEKQ